MVFGSVGAVASIKIPFVNIHVMHCVLSTITIAPWLCLNSIFQHGVSQEDVLRGSEEQPMKDLAFDIASLAHQHLEQVSALSNSDRVRLSQRHMPLDFAMGP